MSYYQIQRFLRGSTCQTLMIKSSTQDFVHITLVNSGGWVLVLQTYKSVYKHRLCYLIFLLTDLFMNTGSRVTGLVLERRRSLQVSQNCIPNNSDQLSSLLHQRRQNDALDEYLTKKNLQPITNESEGRVNQNPQLLTGAGVFQHDLLSCKCKQGDCDRQGCRLTVKKPEMSLRSAYKKDYSRNNNFGESLKMDQYVMRHNSSSIGIGSTYLNDFSPPRNGGFVKADAPRNSITTKPSILGVSSSYKDSYPGYVGGRVPSIPSNHSHFVLGQLFNSDSNYRKNFGEKSLEKLQEPAKYQTKKSDSLFIGQSTYKNSYLKPEEGPLNKQVPSKSPEPMQNNYPSHIGSTYQGSFATPEKETLYPATTNIRNVISSKTPLPLAQLVDNKF